MKLINISKLVFMSVVLLQLVSCRATVKNVKKSSEYVEKEITISLGKNEYQNIHIHGVENDRITINQNVEGKEITLISNAVADSEETFKYFIKRNQMNSNTGNEEINLYVSNIGYFNCSIFDNGSSDIVDFVGACVRRVVINIPKDTKANIFLNKQLIVGEFSLSMVLSMIPKQTTVFDQKRLIKDYVTRNAKKNERFITVSELEEIFKSLGRSLIVDDVARFVSGHIVDPENITDQTLSYAEEYLREDVKALLIK